MRRSYSPLPSAGGLGPANISCDRAGLAACGNLTKGISALAQLAVGDIDTAEELKRALAAIERQDDSLENVLGEALSDHPMIAKRIKALQEFSR